MWMCWVYNYILNELSNHNLYQSTFQPWPWPPSLPTLNTPIPIVPTQHTLHTIDATIRSSHSFFQKFTLKIDLCHRLVLKTIVEAMAWTGLVWVQGCEWGGRWSRFSMIHLGLWLGYGDGWGRVLIVRDGDQWMRWGVCLFSSISSMIFIRLRSHYNRISSFLLSTTSKSIRHSDYL